MSKVILAIGFLSGTINSAIFTGGVKQISLPALTEKTEIVLDNAPVHQGRDLQNIIYQAGHRWVYLPPYALDLNSIEKKWS